MSLIKEINNILSMIVKNLRSYASVFVSSVLVSLFTLFAPSVDVYAQDAPDFVLGNLTLKNNLTKEEGEEIGDKITNYVSSMQKASNGNQTKLNVLLIEDLAKRNIIDEDAKRGFLAFVASMPKLPMEGLPGTLPGNLTIPGNNDLLKGLDASNAKLDEIAKNNSDTQLVTLMTNILKKQGTDIGNLISGNGTDTGPVTISDISWGEAYVKGATCALVGSALSGGSLVQSVLNTWTCTQLM